MKLKSLVCEGDPELIASGFDFTEGPAWHPDGFLLFSDIPANRIFQWSEMDGTSVFLEPSGASNGLAFDHDGRLILCQHDTRALSRLSFSGKLEKLIDSFRGKQLNSPNDLVVKSDGSIYFTDPPYGIQPEQIEQPCNGLYRLTPDGNLQLLKDDFIRPNGLAFNEDESILLVADSRRRHVRALTLDTGGQPLDDYIFADMDHPQPGSPDGMKIDTLGNVFIAGATGIWVFSSSGEHLGVLVTPERPANCCWGDADRCTLYITARTSIYRFRVHHPGLPDIRCR